MTLTKAAAVIALGMVLLSMFLPRWNSPDSEYRECSAVPLLRAVQGHRPSRWVPPATRSEIEEAERSESAFAMLYVNTGDGYWTDSNEAEIRTYCHKPARVQIARAGVAGALLVAVTAGVEELWWRRGKGYELVDHLEGEAE